MRGYRGEIDKGVRYLVLSQLRGQEPASGGLISWRLWQQAGSILDPENGLRNLDLVHVLCETLYSIDGRNEQ